MHPGVAAPLEVTLMTTIRPLRVLVLTGIAALAIGGCGSGDDSGSDDRCPRRVGITDAPLDFAAAVVVTFSGVELKPHGGEAFTIDFATPKTLDLMTLQGVNRALILDGEMVPAGDYEWMRLKVEADPDVAGDSYLQLEADGAQCELRVPSGAETGLKLIRGFTVGAGTTTDITIDFNLRKSVVAPPGQHGGDPLVCGGQAFLLKPVLRVIDNLEVGTITGRDRSGGDQRGVPGRPVGTVPGQRVPVRPGPHGRDDDTGRLRRHRR